jgi:ATP-dependent Zn protease
MKKSARGLFIAIIAVTVVFFFLNTCTGAFGRRGADLSYSDFKAQVEAKNVTEVEWQDATLSGRLADGKSFEARAIRAETPEGARLIALLEDSNVTVRFLPSPAYKTVLPLVGVFLLPVALIVLFYYVFIRTASGQPTSIPKADTRSAEDRLAEADDLLRKGFIREDEHAELRKRILSDL